MKQEVFKTWSLVLQLGISILVPILVLVAIGWFLKEKVGIDIMLILVILGMLSGVRNTYVILKSHLDSIKRAKPKESELLAKHKKKHIV